MSSGSPHELDVLVIGAGFSGLAALHRLRELGLRVRAYDAAGDVGGTWWWHYYPGARLDTEAPVYQYLFAPELVEQWGWSERYPAGYEVQRWLRFVAERLDLRRDIALATRIVGAHWDDDRGRWSVTTDGGETVDARVVVACSGLLPADRPELPGSFAGLVMDTAHWPERYPDLAGRRVGVVGAGTVGVQLVERLVGEVGHLTVLAQHPPHVLPRVNPHYGWQERAAYRARVAELAATLPVTSTGDDHDAPYAWAERTPAEREAILTEAYADGSQDLVRATFRELGHDHEVAREVTAFVRRAMRARLDDDRTAALVIPDDHGVEARPVPLESGYLEALRRDDVDVVTTPIACLRAEGVELADGTVHALDVLVRTDEFDAGPPALTGIDVRGRDGRTLTADRPWTLGLATPGFPNLFSTAMPRHPHRTRSTLLQVQIEWITEAVASLGPDQRLEATPDGEQAWIAHCTELATAALPTEPASYPGGVGEYRRRCAEEAAAGYPSFRRS